jgi:hypothetical protein
MYRAWTASADDPEELSRAVELHLNEFAAEIVSVAYAVDRSHHALVVYRPIGAEVSEDAAEAVATAGALLEERRG